MYHLTFSAFSLISIVFSLFVDSEVAFAKPSSGIKTQAVYNSAYCVGYQQLCTVPNLVRLSVTKTQKVTLKFKTSEIGCSSIRVNPSINGRSLGWSAFLGWGNQGGSEITKTYRLGVLRPGKYLIATLAEGQIGGCNIGYLGSWGGTFIFTGKASSKNPTQSPMKVPAAAGMVSVKL
jgi:hypothetical protein